MYVNVVITLVIRNEYHKYRNDANKQERDSSSNRRCERPRATVIRDLLATRWTTKSVIVCSEDSDEQDGPLSLSSYAVKTATKEKKNVLLLSTLAPMLATTKDDNRNKLALYKLYDFTKGGTDIVDQRMVFQTWKPKSRKWPIVVFSYD